MTAADVTLPESNQPIDVLTEIEAVLTEAGGPLHYRELTRRILRRGQWTTKSRTPERVINAYLSVDFQRLGDASRFPRTDRGIFTLRAASSVDPAPIDHRGPPFPTPEGATSAALPIGADSDPSLSFTDAAEQVLAQFGSGRPMHYRTITQRALELGLIQTQGRTPAATLYSQISTEINRQSKRGETPRFVKQGRGIFGLSRWGGHGLPHSIEQHNAEVRRKLRDRLLEMSPADFETLIGRLLVALGFDDVSVTGYSGDGGIDVRGTLVVGDVIRTRMAVQVKRWRSNVQAPIIQQVRGSLGAHEQGLIISTGGFSPGARDEAELPDRDPVALMDGEQLVALLVEHDLGVRRDPYTLLELGDPSDEASL